MPCARKKVIRKKGKRYYRNKSGLVRLKGRKKAPRKRRGLGCKKRRRH